MCEFSPALVCLLNDKINPLLFSATTIYVKLNLENQQERLIANVKYNKTKQHQQYEPECICNL